MMKKFLSSLLALTMILSLVIVPARAANDYAIELGTSTIDVKGGTSGSAGTTTATAKAPEGVTPSEYSWSSSGAAIENVTGNSSSVTITAKAKGDATITVEMTVPDTSTGAATGATKKETATVKITVTDVQGDANAAFKAAIESAGITYKGDLCKKNSSGAYVYFPLNGDSGELWSTKKSTGYETVTWKAESNKLTATSSADVNGESMQVKAEFAITAGTTSLTLTSSISNPQAGKSVTVLSGGELKLTANYVGAGTPTYEWNIDGKLSSTTDAVLTCPTTLDGSSNTKQYTVVCNAKIDGKPVAQDSCTVTVENYKQYKFDVPSSVTMSNKAQTSELSARLYKDGYPSTALSGVTYRFEALNERYVKVERKNDTTVTLTLLSAGETYIRVTANYLGRDISVDVPFYGEVHEVTLDEVENGKSDTYSYNTLLSAADKTFKGVSIKSIKVNPTKSTYGEIKDSRYADEYVFEAASGKIGVFTFTVTAYEGNNLNGASYTVTFNIPVTPIKTTYESQYPQPSGTSSNYKYSVAVPDGYESYYVVAKNPDKAPTDYSEKLSGTSSSYSGKSLYTLSGSDFDKSGKCELYIVTYDRKTAYYGVLTVYQKSYNIEYRVVAGETLSFDQKAFESFMNDYADDNIKTSKGDYFEFDYVKFTSLPNSTREGTLYEGKDKIKTSTEVENLDKVSFESVAKAKDTIKVPFTLYAKQYDKNDKVIDKKVSMTGEVVISVVKEDIVFEVGVNSAVKLGSDKFIDFLRDSDKSYKKADLDYVTFDVGKNSAITSYFNGTGALYRYYNGSTGINATVSAKDEFYYNPKTSSKHYDLDDVTYVTSKFAKVGDIVYIPFTAYGTKSGQKAEGTLAIKVKQTMNFVDVRPGDYFYDSVQWAVNLGITKGTSATTFSPKTGCTRAQIVTFLWRAAKSPEPRSNTSKFTDVYATAHADYMKAINWATEQGITTGTGNGKFSPDATCTRAQIVTFLYRYKNNPAVYGSLNFSDVNKTEHAAFYNAILWAVNNKITTGYGNGIFDPNGTCNRGDAVTFLYRALA
ncbi:MAG: S-layer homology domain-containing protein [Oscillibacter sp.]|nr:S-layer homology domain-containing protein [Oscillibacter sp.]